MFGRKEQKEIEMFCREFMGNDFWDSLYWYQKFFLYNKQMLKSAKRYKKLRSEIKCLVVNKD